ncbi:archease [Candidatus Micrarchaeota archaeon]|nr:archease [Candidatus Micrarchaeota archaeon]
MTPKAFKFFDHTADILYEGYGATFEEALENASLALFETIADLKKVKTTKSVAIREWAPNYDELAVRVLSDLVAQRDARGLFFKTFTVTNLVAKDGGFSLEGVAKGSAMSPTAGLLDVKAVTHHETKAFEKKGKWTVRVLLDI